MKNGSIQSLACVGLGAVLGFLAATRDVIPSSRAGAAAPAVRQVSAETGVPGQSVGKPSCCSEGVARDVLLAQAGSATTRDRSSPTSSTKRPNVVFIMGDDVGWF